MTLAEYENKISDLKVVRSKSSGLKLAEVTSIIDDLETARVSVLTNTINQADFGFTQEDSDELNIIAQKFNEGTEDIEEANNLIDNAIYLGRKLLSLL